jgi:hypothetical protein
MHNQQLDNDHTICYHSKLIQSKEFAHKLPLFDDGKFLARCVILPLSLCISVNISAFLPLCQHQKEEKTVLSRQHVVAGHNKNDKEANNHKEGSLKSKESLTKNDK